MSVLTRSVRFRARVVHAHTPRTSTYCAPEQHCPSAPCSRAHPAQRSSFPAALPGASEAGEGSGRAPPYPPSHSGTLFAGLRDRVCFDTVDGGSLWGCSQLPPSLPIGMRLRSRCRTWREPAFGRWPESTLRSSAKSAQKLETRNAHMRKPSNGKSIALLCACANQTPKETTMELTRNHWQTLRAVVAMGGAP